MTEKKANWNIHILTSTEKKKSIKNGDCSKYIEGLKDDLENREPSPCNDPRRDASGFPCGHISHDKLCLFPGACTPIIIDYIVIRKVDSLEEIQL